MKEIIFHDDPEALKDCDAEAMIDMRKAYYKEGYKDALEHIIYGVTQGNKKNAPVGSIKDMLKAEIWKIAIEHKER